MKTHITLKRLRDAHLRAAAREVLRRAGRDPVPMGRLVELTLREKAGGYYVSLEHAERMLRLRRAGSLPETMTGVKRLMWDEISIKVEHLMSRYHTTITDAVNRVLSASDASRFFIEPATARRILQRGYRTA